MAEATAADLANDPVVGTFHSARALWSPLVVQDHASPLVEAITVGDSVTIQNMLSQPRWRTIMLDNIYMIYREVRPSRDQNDIREVSAVRRSNIARAVQIAAMEGQTEALATLLDFCVKEGIKENHLISHEMVLIPIRQDRGDVIETLIKFYPELITYGGLSHNTVILYEAVRLRSYEVTATLLRLGANPFKLTKPYGSLAEGYNSSLLSRAAACRGTRMVQLLLDHKVPIAGTAALHTAAAFGQDETVQLLVKHGADINEMLSYWSNWTPMHFAARKGKRETMELLKGLGARSDVKDVNGKTPAEIEPQ